MCGIAGLCSLDDSRLPEDSEKAIGRVLDRMKYRGPDGSGIWRGNQICLGHRRLSIIDLAGGSQPMTGAGGNLTIVFNGEIYNYRTLRNTLIKRGAVFQTNSDTEVIIECYAAFGEGCLEYLEGMFAFVIWDQKNSVLFCARDHFGKKPFYYTIQNGIFAFASELSALAELSGSALSFSFHLEPHALMRYLAYEYVPCPESMYREAKVLEPAHYLLLQNGSVALHRYWDLPMPAEKSAPDETEAASELVRLMTRAVEMRMISDVPLGVFLSGGIDSSIVAGLMAHISSKPIESFSIGFKEASYDESRYARIAAEAFGAIMHERILSAEDCAEELPRIVSKMDTPMADASCAPTWLLASLARERVTVALGGDGADELWAGYEHYIGFNLAIIYNRLPRWVRKSLLEKLAKLLPGSAGYINPRLAVETFLKGAAAPDWLRVQTMLTAIGPEMQKQILSADWLEKYAEENAFLADENIFAPTRLQFEHWKPQSAASSLARAFHVYVRQFMLDDILVKVDRCSMLNSLEVRAPFLDRNVAEFVARLPINYKLHGFKRKYLLKKAFANLLPDTILHRNKRGFQIPVAQWLRGRLKPLLLGLCGKKRLKEQGIFNPDAVFALMERHFSGKEDLRKPLWTLLVLQLWLNATKARL